MKVAHICNFTPRQCGMFETARDIVAAELRAGLDAAVVDIRGIIPAGAVLTHPTGEPCERCGHLRMASVRPEPPAPAWAESRGVANAPPAWAEDADLVVSHSGLLDAPGFLPRIPCVHVAHGRPQSSFLLGKNRGNHVWQGYERYAADPRFLAMVTLWKGFARYWRLVFPREVREVQPLVDLGRWRPFESGYGFNGRGGDVNVVVADIWRMDKDPFHTVFGHLEFARRVPGARLHLYGLSPNDIEAMSPIFNRMERLGALGEVAGHRSDLLDIYNAADMLITPHRIATRTIREALACGLQVVADAKCDYTPYRADPEEPDAFGAEMERAWNDKRNHPDARRNDNRRMAEMRFDPAETIRQLINLYEEVLGHARG